MNYDFVRKITFSQLS